MEIEQKKRGRKTKEVVEEKELPKKRGRKPKGGKIITKIEHPIIYENKLPNIIVHLKCSVDDLIETTEALDAFHFTCKKELEYGELTDKNIIMEPESQPKEDVNNKILWKKIKQLKHSLHNNYIYEKKSSCFWCTFSFTTPIIYIPKFYHKESYESYGLISSAALIQCKIAQIASKVSVIVV